MNKYKVTFFVSYPVFVEAESAEEALKLADELYELDYDIEVLEETVEQGEE
jgi:hypothetical protein